MPKRSILTNIMKWFWQFSVVENNQNMTGTDRARTDRPYNTITSQAHKKKETNEAVKNTWLKVILKPGLSDSFFGFGNSGPYSSGAGTGLVLYKFGKLIAEILALPETQKIITTNFGITGDSEN